MQQPTPPITSIKGVRKRPAIIPRTDLSVAEVAQHLSYDPRTGEITRRIGRGAGRLAGGKRYDGYYTISVCGQRHYAHRLAWLLAYGEWPEEQIDHIDGNPSNNAICNLRSCSNQENCQNLGVRKNNSSGLTGVYWSRERKRWVAQIRIDGKITPLGRFHHKQDAHAAFLAAKRRAHTFQPTPRGM